jgi:hypothetical protein
MDHIMSARLSLLTACLVFSVAAADPAPVKPARPAKIFNGRDLTGFYTFLEHGKYDDPKAVITVRDGMIRISGEEWGGLTTKDAYREYHLRVEWKWGAKTWGDREGKARDSGILLHGTGPDTGGRRGYWLQSIEYQVIEGGTGDLILVQGETTPALTAEVREEPDGEVYWQKGGKSLHTDSKRINWYGRDPKWHDILGFRGRRDVEHPAGEWNVSEVLCDGDSITAMLNGKVVNHATQASQAAGKILIQSEGAEIFIRHFEIGPVTDEVRKRFRP